MTNTRAIGDSYETWACAFLVNQGYTIIARNYRVARVGEIDIIAYYDNTLIAVEVKARTRQSFGSAVEQVTLAKQKKIIKTMGYFLQDERYAAYANACVRFDVIGFDGEQIAWVQGAFLVS